MRLKGKCAVITGAAAGIGEATTRLFCNEGAAVVAVDRDRAAVERLAAELGREDRRCHALVLDLTLEEDCRRVVEWTEDQVGGIDILVNNAGIVHQGTLVEASGKDWDEAMTVNAKSMFWMAKFTVPRMLERKGGSIVNMASIAGISGVANRGVYSVSKFAVVGLTRSLATDYVRHGIRVNCICPATVDTPSLRRRIASAPDPITAESEFLARQPMGRIAKPEEIASLALYLASDESTYMTGQAIAIDGGMKL